MNAPCIRSAARHLVVAFASIAVLATVAPATVLAQSARSAVPVPTALGSFSPNRALVPNHEKPRCVAVPADSNVSDIPAQSYSVDGLAGTDDDAIDADLLSPGSGMVVVDSHGKIIEPEEPEPTPVNTARTECCPVSPTVEAPSISRRASGISYPANNGSDMRASCVDAMNPPPSSRSPL